MVGKIIGFYGFDEGPKYGLVLRVNAVTLRVRWLDNGHEQRVPRASMYATDPDRDEWGDLPFAPPLDAT